MGIRDTSIKNVSVPLVMVATIVIGAFAIDNIYVHAGDLQKFQYQQAVRDAQQWIVILEQKKRDAKSTEEKESLERQIETTTESLYINMKEAAK